MILLIANKILNTKSLHKIYRPRYEKAKWLCHISAILIQGNAHVNVRNQPSSLVPTFGSKSKVHEGVFWTLRATSHETESPWPLHFKHSHWWKGWSRSKFASHYAWGTNGVCECKIDVKSIWIPTWHRMDHVSWSLGLFWKPTSWR